LAYGRSNAIYPVARMYYRRGLRESDDLGRGRINTQT